MEKEKILTYVSIGAVIFSVLFIVLGLSNLNTKKSPNSVQTDLLISTTTITNVAPRTATTTTKKDVGVKEVKQCASNNTDFDCYYEYYYYVVKNKGINEAFRVLKEEYKSNSYVIAQCHPIAHVIGHAAVSLYPKVYDAFKHGDPFCWSGYYHGVMEEVVEKVGTAKIKTELDNICSGISGKESYSFDYYNCVHGLGHGVMAINDNELFKSLSLCDSLSGVWEQNSCYGGVYMENVIIDNKGEATKYLKPSDPLYPCNAVDEKYKGSCYLMQTSYALKVSGNDYSKVFALCRTADVGYKEICWQSLGRDASGMTSSNAESTKQKCDLGQNYEEKSNCIIGAVKDFVSFYHSDVEAKQFCSILSSDLKQICIDTGTSYYQNF